MARSKPDPGEWARPSDAELEARAQDELERMRAAEGTGGTSRPQPLRSEVELPTHPDYEGQRWTVDGVSTAFPPILTHVSGRRLIAHFADALVLIALAFVLLLLAATISDVALIAALVALATAGQLAYFVLTQRGGGRSPGKRLVGIRVVDADAEVPSTGAIAQRTIPLFVEYFYVIALAAMLSSAYRQRLGDRWGHTYVIDDRWAA